MTITRVIGTLAIVLFVMTLLVALMPVHSAFATVLPEDPSSEEIEGTIMWISPEGTAIVIDGKTIYIDDDTRIDGMLAVGAEADVEAVVRDDGSLLALRITVDEDVELEGTITKIVYREDGTIKKIFVDGIKVFVNMDTEIEGMLVVGAMVEVDAVPHHGFLLATRIKIEADDSVLP